MHKLSRDFPNLQALTAGLTSALRRNGRTGYRLTVLARKPSPRASTFPSEIVRCRTEEGTELHLLCKYAIAYRHDGRDNRQGLTYEASVYREILQPLQTTTPTFYGVHTDRTTGETWLVLEYLGGSVPVNHTPEPAALIVPAARWISGFHAINEARSAGAPFRFLISYDAEYYLGWARRTLLFAADLRRRYPWLETACRKYEELVDLLVAQPATIIHGEYDSDNLLFRNGLLYPVDWESAAVAAGEIDVARLTWGWPSEIAKRCELEYQRTRWPEGAPPDFERTLAVARLYLPLRFLGERPEWTIGESSSELFEELRSAGERLGLI